MSTAPIDKTHEAVREHYGEVARTRGAGGCAMAAAGMSRPSSFSAAIKASHRRRHRPMRRRSPQSACIAGEA